MSAARSWLSDSLHTALACPNVTGLASASIVPPTPSVLARSAPTNPLGRVLTTQTTWSDVPLHSPSRPRRRRKSRPRSAEILSDAMFSSCRFLCEIQHALSRTSSGGARTRQHQRADMNCSVQRRASLARVTTLFSIPDRDSRYHYVNNRVLELTGRRRRS